LEWVDAELRAKRPEGSDLPECDIWDDEQGTAIREGIIATPEIEKVGLGMVGRKSGVKSGDATSVFGGCHVVLLVWGIKSRFLMEKEHNRDP
jgi:hypothetical protein